MLIRKIGKAIFDFKSYGLTLINYKKGTKSFMSLENNFKDISFDDIINNIGENHKEFVQKFREAAKSSNLTELNDGQIKIILENYQKETGEVAFDSKTVNKKDNHFKMFYNLVQLVERDITLLVANQYFKDLEITNGQNFKGVKILQGKASSGVKALRYAKEIDPSYIQDITVIEKDINFPEYFKLLAHYNDIDMSKFKIVNKETSHFYLSKILENMDKYDQPEQYDFIDIEEYGSSIDTIRQAIKLVKNGGMISAMFTDMSTLCGPNVIKCYSSYNKFRIRLASLNENAIRIIYSTILDIATQNNYSIEPIVSFQSDFYIKIFFKVHHNGVESQKALEKLSLIYQCSECPNYHVHKIAKVQQNTIENVQNGTLKLESSMDLKLNELKAPSNCNVCESSWILNGPIWNQPLHNYKFVQNVLRNLQSTGSEKVFSKNKIMLIQSHLKLTAYLEAILQEKEFDNFILGYNLALINGFYKAKTYPTTNHIKRALARAGYTINRSIFEKKIYKTNAPSHVIFDTMRGWKWLSDKFKEGQSMYQNQNQTNQKQPEQEDQNSPYSRAMRKQQQFYPKFSKLNHLEIEKIKNNNIDMEYFQKPQKTVFYPNPTENWGPKKPFSVAYTHKFEKQKIKDENLEDSQLISQNENDQNENSSGEEK
ncbi:hypothetical protein ABPG74_007999 [Tetrahymena malaccensis]